jgi:hypothetical protein
VTAPVAPDADAPGVGEPGAGPPPGGAFRPGEEGPPGGAGVVTASSMDSITLPERSRHDGAGRRVRRRRSAAHSPVVVAPIDIPEDAEGRVEIFAVRAPGDATDAVVAAPLEGHRGVAAARTAEAAAGGASPGEDGGGGAPVAGSSEVLTFGAAPALGERPRWSAQLLALRSGWAAVLVLAVLLAALFVLGDLLTH